MNTVYIADISPAFSRGLLTSFPEVPTQFFFYFLIMASFSLIYLPSIFVFFQFKVHSSRYEKKIKVGVVIAFLYIVSMIQVFVNIGTILGYIFNYAFSKLHLNLCGVSCSVWNLLSPDCHRGPRHALV